MRFNVISYLFKEGILNVFKNKKSTISSLMIMCATMLIFGIFFVIGENINSFVKSVEDAQGISVYLVNTATDEEIERVGEEILQIDGVRDAKYISKEEALEKMRDRLGDSMVEGYIERNIFPASYEVTLTNLELNEEVQQNILKIENVDEIRSSNLVIDQIIRLAKGIKVVTWVILVLLIIISTAIISNTIKLTVHARRKEISIMKYVGATNSFIRWPFLVEGIIIGVVAGAISVGIIGLAYTYIVGQISGTSFFEIANIKFIEFSSMSELLILVYLGLGIGVGAIGSTISMKKYLEV